MTAKSSTKWERRSLGQRQCPGRVYPGSPPFRSKTSRTPAASIAPSRSFETEIESNEWPIVPTDGLDDFLEDPEPIEEETPNWRDRLVFDFDVSDISPVVRGTWITVSHVVSLIVDGWTWADILRAHPELLEADIRTCVAYAMAEENSAQ